MTSPETRFAEMMDRYGPDFGSWLDAEAASWARRELLANPAARALRDEAVRLDEELLRYGDVLDQLAGAASTQRVGAGVLARLPARRINEVSWWLPRIAAGFLLAIIAGGAFDLYVTNPVGDDAVETAALDTFIYGPGELDL